MTVKTVWEGEEVKRRVLSFSCNRCGAGQGERCVTKSGHQRYTGWHALRWYSAVRAGLVPVFEENGEPAS